MTLANDVQLGGRYRLLERIAVGGMGEVWRASDELLQREVAVKVLKHEYADEPGFLERFRAEARHTAGLSHAGIASIYDYGELDGTAYIVMELVPGEPLSHLLARERRLPLARTLDVVQQAATALAAAHATGVVHRDVKPGNILVTADDRVKVTDFGIARAADTVSLTQTGTVLGTAHYLSPEQAAGQTATAESDVYSLGVVMFECLAGYRPFSGDTPVAIALAHVHSEPAELPDDVPPGVRQIVETALAKSPTDRFPTASAFADAIAALRSSPTPDATLVLPTPVPPAPVRLRWSPWWWAAGALATLLVLLVVVSQACGVRDERNRVAVPGGLVGAQVAAATDILDRAGFEVSQRNEPGSAAAGTVVAVEPPSGTELDEGATVTLVVSDGSVQGEIRTPTPDPRDEDEDKDKDGNKGKGKGRGGGDDD